MADNDTVHGDEGMQAEGASASDAQTPASNPDDGNVSVLKSQFAGASAKVNELTGQIKTLKAQHKELQDQLRAAHEGTTTADEAAKALIAAKDAELAQVRREAQLARIESKYPEVFRELGEDAASLSAEKLAAMEARLKGAGFEDDEPPTPRGQQAARRDSTSVKPQEKTLEDMYAELERMPVPEQWGGSWRE